MSAPGTATEIIGRIAYSFSSVQPFLPTYLHLIASAIFPIYTGAHASLSPPSSAAKSSKTKIDADADDEDTSEINYQKMEGMSATDALMIPLMAGCTLAILYFLIKWLQDPTLLNLIINWYLSFFGILSIARLSTDILGVISTFVFPVVYADNGQVWKVRRERRVFETSRAEGDLYSKPNSRPSPLPGALARLSLSPRLLNMLWTLRELPARKLHFRVHVYKFPDVQFRVGLYGFGSTLLAISVSLYFNLVDKPWWLTNLLGFSVSYSVLQLLSPTTFWTGTMVLGSLFIYDIYFVFFTPLMITVATKLDIPAKLLFPRPRGPDDDPNEEALSMLGLGDVVLPGIMIGLALRFDLYLFYLRQQSRGEKNNDDDDLAKKATRIAADEDTKDVEVDVTSEKTGAKTGDSVKQNSDENSSNVKASWRSATGRWGERFWLGRYSGNGDHREGGAFPKLYFHAALAGYIFGMVCTLGVMQIYSRAQPALLYLVPGVLGSLWCTAFVKGDLRVMWEYMDATEEEISENGKQGQLEKPRMKSIFSFARHEGRARKTVKEGGNKAGMDDTENEAKKTTEVEENHSKTASLHAAENRQLFLFSISLPQKPSNRDEENLSPETATKPNGELGNASKSEQGTETSSDGSSPRSNMFGGKPNDGDELARKRQRIF